MTSEKDNIINLKRLANDTEYFTSVFKRTEKIVSVIFYVLSHNEEIKDSNTIKDLVKDKALATHGASLATLRLLPQEAKEGLVSFQHALVSLESTLRLAEAASVIPANINLLLFEQLLNVQRFLTNHYLTDQGSSLINSLSLESGRPQSSSRPKLGGSRPPSVRRRHGAIPAGDISSDAVMVYSHLNDRSARIKTVLEAKPQATIKDIAEIITDVSEKTIQRELNSLIEKGQVLREGERRWSKYSVQK